MLRTIEGYWDPILWIIAFIVIAIIAYIIRSAGRKEHKKGEQAKPYFSGVEIPSDQEIHVSGENIYWGFVESLKGYYSMMKKMHAGRINDYVAWFVGISAILFIAIFIMEVS
ncbi:MAG TPA: hydrogenase [Thermoplasmatales archaeon]|nr:hydrogenase [Thermoplasmatales archaeon]